MPRCCQLSEDRKEPSAGRSRSATDQLGDVARAENWRNPEDVSSLGHHGRVRGPFPSRASLLSHSPFRGCSFVPPPICAPKISRVTCAGFFNSLLVNRLPSRLARYFRRGSYRKRTGGCTESIRKAGCLGLMRAFCSTWTITLGTSSATLRCSIIHWSPMVRLAALAGSESHCAGRSPMEGASIRSSGISMAKSHRSSNRRGVRMCASVSRQASATELEA